MSILFTTKRYLSSRLTIINPSHCVKSVRIRSYSRMQENAAQNNSEYKDLLRSVGPNHEVLTIVNPTLIYINFCISQKIRELIPD